jgi:hypothetical protein
MNASKYLTVTILALTLLPAIGCDESKEVARVAEESAKRQAEQTNKAFDLSKQVAEGSKHLVDSDAEARRELIAIQGTLQLQRADVDRQRDKLEVERRTMVAERQAIVADQRKESMLGHVFRGSSLALVVVVAFVFCCYLVRAASSSDSTVEINELFLTEILADEPTLLSGPTVPQTKAAVAIPASTAT